MVHPLGHFFPQLLEVLVADSSHLSPSPPLPVWGKCVCVRVCVCVCVCVCVYREEKIASIQQLDGWCRGTSNNGQGGTTLKSCPSSRASLQIPEVFLWLQCSPGSSSIYPAVFTPSQVWFLKAFPSRPPAYKSESQSLLSGCCNYVLGYLPVSSHVPTTPPVQGGLKWTGVHRGHSREGEKPMLGEALFFVSTNTETDNVSPRVQISTSKAKNRRNALRG